MSLIINPYSFAAGGTTNPSDVLSPELWLRGDFITGLSNGDTITTNWPDGSGNARNATAVQGNTRKPKWLSASGPNSKPCVEMISSDAQGGWFTLPNFLTGFTSGEAMVVEQRDSDTPGDSFASPTLGGWGSDDDEYFPFSGDGKIYHCFGSSVRKTGNNPTTNLTSWITFNARSASASWVYSILGATAGNDFFSTGTNTVAWSTAARVAHVNTNDKSMKGRVAELIFWSRVLNDTTERKAIIHAYLNARYGFSLPT